MPKAESVLSTPRTNTSALAASLRLLLNHPVNPLPMVTVLTICTGTVLLHVLIAVMS